jgi:pimeloyl-ACP methyl ester carboxylesterase
LADIHVIIEAHYSAVAPVVNRALVVGSTAAGVDVALHAGAPLRVHGRQLRESGWLAAAQQAGSGKQRRGDPQHDLHGGLQPLDHASEVSIPIFLYHGELDITVPISQSERFVNALKRAGKPVKFLELKNMGHQSNKWEPGQVGQVLRAVDDYLRTECGPGGI